MSGTSSTKPAPWTLTPQATAAPTLWFGALAVWPFWEGVGATVRDASPQGKGFDGTMTGDMVWGVAGNGVGVRSPDHRGSDAIELPDGFGVFHGGTNFSVLIVWRYEGANAVQDEDCYLFHPRAEYDISMFATPYDNVVKFGYWDGSSNYASASVTHEANKTYVVVGRWDNDFTGNADVWVDGVRGDTTTNAGIPNITSDTNVMGGQPAISNYREMNGTLLMGAVWDRALQDGEIRHLSADPYAMIRPMEF